MKKIKVAIIVDFMGSLGLEPEDEIKSHEKRVRLWLPGREIDFTHTSAPLFEIDPDLVIYDFGGLMPGSDLLDSNARAVVEWARDHPNSLVIVVSAFSFNHHVKWAMKDIGVESMFNIIAHDTLPEMHPGDIESWMERHGNPIPEWWLAGL